MKRAAKQASTPTQVNAEASRDVSIDRVAQVLRGAREYDELSSEEQAVVRAHWFERIIALADALQLEEEFAAESRPYVELDEEGAVVRRDPKGAPASDPTR